MSSQKSKQFPTTIGAERGTFKQSFTQATLNSKLNPATIKVLCPAMLRHPEFMFKRGKRKKKKNLLLRRMTLTEMLRGKKTELIPI